MPQHFHQIEPNDQSEKTPPKIEGLEVEHGSAKNPIDNHLYDADEAMKLYERSANDHIVIDNATAKRLLRRIDYHLMPVSQLSL